MRYVPAGAFTIGNPPGGGDEEPQHSVTLDPFWIDGIEVSNAQYRQCVEVGTCRAPTSCFVGTPTFDDPSKAGHPVVCVSWDDARAYCQWARARLPTEAEWEKAARGTDGRKYPWGDSFDGTKANLCDRNCEYDWADGSVDDGNARTAPVGSYAAGASPYGVLDMVGNVMEWVQDWYGSEYYGHSPTHNPLGPGSGRYRVPRGGSWHALSGHVRSAFRGRRYQHGRDGDYGFRCGLSATASP
jgi:formylglycine-generating enzyme required for sulfatase activity